MDNLSVNKHDLHIRRVDQECQFMVFFSAFADTNSKRLMKRKHIFVILRIHNNILNKGIIIIVIRGKYAKVLCATNNQLGWAVVYGLHWFVCAATCTLSTETVCEKFVITNYML